ncbi:MAG: YbaB/EbfC family nucleoid-associated protein [Gordonia sp. (in: high G+C Gram-positive bacteria)]|uniref:YbaB/EbfC family nucleoid-associated protein n=1 Tax=Gordonia sp. (in: high G+C Gram-positive bacteria) TaxID=84139 RepID=UPI0039E42C9D
MTAAMDRITAAAAAHLAVLERAHQELSALSATARTDDGRVEVRVDANGGLAGLILRPGAARGDAARLAQLITEAAAEAAHEVADRRADLTREFVAELGGDPDGESDPGTDPSLGRRTDRRRIPADRHESTIRQGER